MGFLITHRIKAIVILAMLIIWLMSCAFSYRYAKQQVELSSLREFQQEVASANTHQRKMLNEFDKLSKQYAIEQEQRMLNVAQMEHYIYEYLETASDNCNIDDRGVQLINQLIQKANIPTGR